MQDIQIIAARLKHLRASKGLTVRDVEKTTGLTNGNISGWENGRYLPGATALALLSELYDVSIDFILTGEENSKVVNLENTLDPKLALMIDYMKDMWQESIDRQGWLKIQFCEAFGSSFEEWQKKRLGIKDEHAATGA